MQANVKITDVAKLAGVAPSTVSRVLTNHMNVSQSTKKRVHEAIVQLNYKPNRLASNLRKNYSKLVMVILPDITNPFFNEVVRGLQSVARLNGYHVLLGDTGNDVDEEMNLIDLVNEKFVDGVIMTTARIAREELLELCSQLPVVLSCQYPEDCDIPTVSIDNVTAAREATQHLIKLGHRRIGFITGPLPVIVCRDRLKGYRQALEMEEIPVKQAYIQEGDFSVQSGYNVMRKYLAMDEPPTAVFASSDLMAAGAVQYVKEAGKKVPEDISVIGFDDIPLCTLMEPQLTTVGQPKYEMGKQAMTMLLQILDKEPVPRTQIVLPHQLIERNSCAPWPNLSGME